jgi:hypothetical protein
VQRIDLPAFQALLTEVYECYGNRAPSAQAMLHWGDALHSFPFHNVERVLRNWLHTQKKAPVIADITKPCADLLSDSVEQRAEADRKAFAAPIVFKGVTPHGRKCIAQMRALLAKPKRPSKEWARKIMENPNSNELQREFAKGVYVAREREPGDDDDLPMPALDEETVEM